MWCIVGMANAFFMNMPRTAGVVPCAVHMRVAMIMVVAMTLTKLMVVKRMVMTMSMIMTVVIVAK